MAPLVSNEEFLLQALAVSQDRLGSCAPNPAVGAVVVKDGVVLATGKHLQAGSPHAEVDALNKVVGYDLEGAILYVTLEPCCHWGRTPPCIDLIIGKKISAVYYGYKDPNPVVSGEGERLLKAAGIVCEMIAVKEIYDFYRYYQYWHDYKVPWVDVKLAISLDGKIAGHGMRPVAITGQATQRFTHKNRQTHDAILTTARTVIQDNPQLNVRLNGKEFKKPVYVLDRELKILPTAKIFSTAEKITIFHGPGVSLDKRIELVQKGAVCKEVLVSNKKLDLSFVLSCIGEDGMQSVWAEVGGECFESFVQLQLAQRGFLCLAPKILGEMAYSAKMKPLEILSNAKNVTWLAKDSEDMICELTW